MKDQWSIDTAHWKKSLSNAQRSEAKRPRFFIPPRSVPSEQWQCVDHRKFPKPVNRTQKWNY